MYLLISDDKHFTDIISVTKDTLRSIADQFEDAASIMMWRLDEDVCKFKVGDAIPFDSQFGLYILKRYGSLLPAGPREKFVDRDDDDFKLTKEMFDLLSQNKIDLVKEELKKITSDDEVFYRVFYNSFKMYRLRNKCFQIAQLLKHMAGTGPLEFKEDNHLFTLDLTNFDKTLQLSLKKVSHAVFTMDQNDSFRWADDARTLVGTYQMLVQALDYLIRFSQDIVDKKGFIFDTNNKFGIDWHEAGAMEVYLPLKQFRGTNHDKIKSYLGL